MGANASIPSAEGFDLGVYVAEPEGSAKGAVVVIQEIFGVNQHIREVTDGYAAQGYYAIARRFLIASSVILSWVMRKPTWGAVSS